MSIPKLQIESKARDWESSFALAHRLIDIGEFDAAIRLIDQIGSLMTMPEGNRSTAEVHQNSRKFSLSRLNVDQRSLRLNGHAPGFNVRFLGGFALFFDGEFLHLPPRLQEVLLLLLLFPRITPEQIGVQLFEDGQVRPVKASVSKLRKYIPVSTSPYLVTADVLADVHEVKRALSDGDVRRAVELYKGPLLPRSFAPGIARERYVLDESIKRAVLGSGNSELILALTDTHEEDLEIWEAAQRVTEHDDPRRHVIDVEVERIRSEWGLAGR